MQIWTLRLLFGGLALVAVAAVLMFVVGLLLSWRSDQIASRTAQRGFDVKLATDGLPVALKKEDDHG